MAYKRIILFLTLVTTLLGVVTYFIMPREEDPKIKRRNATTSVLLPGASPEKVQRLVVKPIEDELLKVQELKTIEVEIRLNVAVFKMELKDGVKNISEAWREVERALERTTPLLPDGITVPTLDFSVIAVESVVLAVTGTDDLVTLVAAAKKIKDRLLENSQVSEVKIFGDPGLEILVAVDSEKVFSQGISINQLLSGLNTNHRGETSGLIIESGRKFILRQDNDLSDPQMLGKIRYETGQLRNIRLGELATISKTASAEPRSIFRFNGKPAVGLGLVAEDSLNIVNFGEQLSEQIESIRAGIAPLRIETVAYQPIRTADRLKDLMLSLFSGILLITVFLGLTSGFSMALIVSVCVPIISSIGLFIYYLNGGVLHQISIAAFVISIGQFIDNIIVIVDSVQQKIKKGLTNAQAAAETARQMRWPMAFATLTGICAFLPMLSSEGPTADFTFSLPQIAIITLVSSYFVSLYFVPVISEYLLKRSSRIWLPLPLEKLENIFKSLALGPAWKIITLVSVIFLLSMLSLVKIKKDFFPESDRQEFLFTAELLPNADIFQTDKVLAEIEDYLKQDSRVSEFASFSGGNMPRFYYNLPSPQRAPQVGQLLVTTRRRSDVKPLGLELEQVFKKRYPELVLTAQFLQQGPPTNAKIEFNVFTENPERRALLSQQIENILNTSAGTRSVRSDAATGLEVMDLLADDHQLSDIGFDRAQLNAALAFYSSGVHISDFRFDRELLPVIIRDNKGPYKSSSTLMKAKAFRGRARDYRIEELAELTIKNEAPLLRRENGRTFTRVLSDLQPGTTFSGIMSTVMPQVQKIQLNSDEKISYGGDAKGAGEANSSIFKVVPLAFTLLILFLLIEFQSFKKLFIALLALPVTLMGVFPGLWLGGAPFGFMSLLGLLALVGVAINNIILLMEALGTERSISEALSARFRSIFLTTALTLLGLIPLALEDSSLWPPLAWTMISGLITGTVATLIVVPALYRFFFKNAVLSMAVISGLLMAGFPTESAQAQSLNELMGLSHVTNEHTIQDLAVQKSEEKRTAAVRDLYAPKIYLEGTLYKRNRDLKSATPFGEALQEEKDGYRAGAELRQTLFDYGKMWNRSEARKIDLASEQSRARYLQRAEQMRIAALAIEVLLLQREKKYLHDSILNLQNRAQDIKRLIAKGRLSPSDLLNIEISVEKLNQQKSSLDNKVQSREQNLKELLQFNQLSVNAPSPITSLNLPSGPTLTGDIESLNLQGQSLLASSKQIEYATLPVFEAYYRATTTDGNTLTTKQWDELGIAVRWEIFSGGVRQTEARALKLEGQMLQKKAADLNRELTYQFTELKEETSRNFTWMKQISSLAEKALRNKKIEEMRYFEGRGNLNDLVQADNLHLELRRDQDIVNLNTLLGCMQLKLWAGQKITADCDGGQNSEL